MKPSLKITSESAIPRRFSFPYYFDEFARACSQRPEFMKLLMLVAAVVLLATTMLATTMLAPPMLATPMFATPMLARTPAFDNSEKAAPAATTSSPAQDTPVTPPSNPAQPAPATTSATGQSDTGAAPLRVMVGKSLLINTTERLKRVSVTDPSVADALVVTPTQVLVNGLAPGEISLLIWDELERSRSFDLRVDVDISAATEEIHKVFPSEKIDVTPSRSAIVLSGHVTTEDVAKHAGALASAYSKNVVNVLTFGPVGADEILLEVKFAEVDRSALMQLGINMFSTGAGNTQGTITTGQFGGVTPGPITATGGTGTTTTTTSITNFLNLFFFNPQVHLGGVIEALQARNLLQILAEPNLIAVNGKESSFLAGGEFPFPVVQPGATGISTVTIQFREFGVRLRFTPVIQPNGAWQDGARRCLNSNCCFSRWR